MSRQEHKHLFSKTTSWGEGILPYARLPLLFLIMFSLAVSAFAAHDTVVTVSPDYARCGDLPLEYTINVYNKDTSADSVREVRIYDDVDGDGQRDPGIVDFQCGPAPTGWTLDDRLALYNYCHYETGVAGGYMIDPDEDLDFSFSAQLDDSSLEECGNEFKIASIDDKIPIGEVVFKFPKILVDCSDPVVTKAVGTPKVLISAPGCDEGPFQGEGETACDWWIRHGTEIETEATEYDECDLGLDYCEITYTVDGGAPITQVHADFEPETYDWDYDWDFDEDSVHVIEIKCTDVVGNKTVVTESDKVDDTPPVTTKVVSEPKKIDSGVEWIDSVTEISLSAEDKGETCHIGVENTFYNIIQAEDSYCWEQCAGWQPGIPNREGEGWTQYTGPISDIAESCHVMEYYSVDKIGNIEDVKVNCFFVDKTAPEQIKTIGEPNVPCRDLECEEFDYWVRDQSTLPGTEITLDCDDSWSGKAPHPSGDEEVCYKVSYDIPAPMTDITAKYCPEALETVTDSGYEGDWCCIPAPEVIVFAEDSLHNLEYFCMDAVNKKSPIDLEYFRVDSQPPIIDKTMSGPQIGGCPPGEGEDCWIKDWEQAEGTTIHIEATDDDTYGCAVDDITCEWSYKLDGEPMQGEGCLGPSFDIKFYDETQHELLVKCCDKLGNCAEDVETFYVDSSGPTVEKEFIGPKKIDGSVEWIDSVTTIELTATDQPDAPCAVGEDKIYYVITPMEDDACWMPEKYCYSGEYMPGAFTEYAGPIGGIEESCHRIEFYAVDKLGNIGPMGKNCFFVDKTAPTITKDNGDAIPDTGEPAFMTEDNPGGDFNWISKNMPITFTCEDQGDHPSGDEELCYKVSYDYVEVEPGAYDWGYITGEYCSTELTAEGYCCMTGTAQEPFEFYFQEDSMHNLEYYCRDAVEKSSGVHVQYYKVDTEGPEITKTLNEPYYGECPPEDEGDVCYVDSATTIDVETEDGGEICAVGGVECRWQLLDVSGYPVVDWTTDMPISFPEECQHTLVIECEDALGNVETDTETFFVDKTPPGIWKEYGSPYFAGSVDDWEAEWINKNTLISAGVTDDGPHQSGIAAVEYRATIVDEEYCRNRDEDEMVCEDAEGSGVWTEVEAEDWDEFEFSITEESCHLIEIYAEDNVEKNRTHKQCVFVDSTAPTPEKTVGEPKTPWDGKDSQFYELDDFCSIAGNCWAVTLLTPIALECIDPQPHPVDNETVCFYVERNADNETAEYCEFYGGSINDEGFCCMEKTTPEFYFLEECEHNLQYYCVDALGNMGPIDDEKFKVAGTTFEIQLNKKWNLVSVPYVLLNDDIEEVLSGVSDNLDSVWQYDAVADQWYVYRPDDPLGSNLSTIEPGWGYWIAMDDADLLTIGGSLFSPVTTPPERALKHGWNLIGYYGAEGQGGYYGPVGSGKMARCALFSLGESFTDKGWTALLTYWEPDNPGQWKEYSYYQSLDPGAGYWLFASEDSIYSYVTICGG